MNRKVRIYDDYDLYDDGNIYSHKSKRWLVPHFREAANQYYVTLVYQDKHIVVSIAKLVAENFVKKPNTDEKLVVAHANLDTTDNRAENLIWLTQKSFLNQKEKLGIYSDLREKHRVKIRLINRLECIEQDFNSITSAAKYLKSIKPDAPSITTICSSLSKAIKTNGTVYNWMVIKIE